MARSPYATPHAADVPHQDLVEKYATHSPSPAPPDAGNERIVIEHGLDDVEDRLRFVEKQTRRR